MRCDTAPASIPFPPANSRGMIPNVDTRWSRLARFLDNTRWNSPPKWIYCESIPQYVSLRFCTCPVAGLPAKLGALGIATFWGVGALAFQSISNAAMKWFIADFFLSKSKMIAKRTSLGGGAYETSFALGVAGAPSSTASRVSRNAPLSRTQSHEFSASLGYLVPFVQNVLRQRFSQIVPLTKHNSWCFSMSWKEKYLSLLLLRPL